jgi:hypothetical protein
MAHRIIQLADEHGEFVTDVDGFVKWWPKTAGCLSEHDLRTLANEMERRNAAWTADINKYFEGKPHD